MKLRKWPVTEDEYWDALRQLMQFVALFKLLNVPLESEVRLDVEESEQLMDKLYVEACQKFDLVSEVDFWKWCYKKANDRLIACGG